MRVVLAEGDLCTAKGEIPVNLWLEMKSISNPTVLFNILSTVIAVFVHF